MKVFFPKSYEDLLSCFDNIPLSGKYFFRGHADSNWKLLPGLGRNKNVLSVDKLLSLESNILNDFRQSLKQHGLFDCLNLSHVGYNQDWQLWMIGQHYGLPTRLIDFSNDKYCALQFAVFDLKYFDKCGALFLYENTHHPQVDIEENFTFATNSFMLQAPSIHTESYIEQLSERRKLVQGSKFFYRPTDKIFTNVEVEKEHSDRITKIIIDSKYKIKLIEYLISKFKFNRDLVVGSNIIDSLAAIIKYKYINQYD